MGRNAERRCVEWSKWIREATIRVRRSRVSRFETRGLTSFMESWSIGRDWTEDDREKRYKKTENGFGCEARKLQTVEKAEPSGNVMGFGKIVEKL